MYTLLLSLFLNFPIGDSIVYQLENKARIGDTPTYVTLKVRDDTLHFGDTKYYIAQIITVDFDPVTNKFDQTIRCLTENDEMVVFYIWRSEKALRILFKGYLWKYYEEKKYPKDTCC